MQRANDYIISCNKLMNRTWLTKACNFFNNDNRTLVSINITKEYTPNFKYNVLSLVDNLIGEQIGPMWVSNPQPWDYSSRNV